MTKWSTYRLKDRRKQPDSENPSIPGLNNNIGTQIDQSNHNLNRAPVAHVEIKKLRTWAETPPTTATTWYSAPNEDASKNQPGKQHRRQNQKLTQAAKARSCCTPKRATCSWRMKKPKMGPAAHGPRTNQRQQKNLCARATEQEMDSTEVTSGKTIPWRAMARKTNPPAWIPARENQKRAEIFWGTLHGTKPREK
jgi:hypothetical protein